MPADRQARGNSGESRATEIAIDDLALVLKAGGDAMRREVDRVMPLVEDGGYIPEPDHAIPPDVPPVMVSLSEVDILRFPAAWLPRVSSLAAL